MAAANQAPIEAVLRVHTDIFDAPREVLAIAPESPLDEMLAAAATVGYDRSGVADVERLHYASASFDAVIGDADALAEGSHRPLRDLARLLRPGGRLVLGVSPGRASHAARDLRRAGFLVVPAHRGAARHVLVGIRGEHVPAAP